MRQIVRDVQFFSDLAFDEQVDTLKQEIEEAILGEHRVYNANQMATLTKWISWIQEIKQSAARVVTMTECD